MVDRLRELGVDITWPQVEALAEGGVVGRPHVARAMVAAGAISRPEQAFTPEWIGAGIRLNALAPGNTDTAMFAERFTDSSLAAGAAATMAAVPAGRTLTADEIAAAAIFLVGPDATAFVGSVVYCDGGYDALLNPQTPPPLLSAP